MHVNYLEGHDSKILLHVIFYESKESESKESGSEFNS